VLHRRPKLAPSSLLRPLLDAVPLLLPAKPGCGASTCSRHRKLRRGVRPGARSGTGQEAGQPCGPGSRTPASSPPYLSSMQGATLTWPHIAVELGRERARRTVQWWKFSSCNNFFRSRFPRFYASFYSSVEIC
jgi:hypothetical protein